MIAGLTQAMEHTLSTLGPGEGGTSERGKIIISHLTYECQEGLQLHGVLNDLLRARLSPPDLLLPPPPPNP
jgi:hypothetical protein